MSAFVVAAVGLAVAGVVGVVIWRLVLLLPGGRVAQVEAAVRPPHAFELRYVTTSARAYRLAVRLRRHGQASSGGTVGGRAPVSCRFRVAVDGRLLVEDAVGFGGVPADKVRRLITTGYLSHETRSGGEYVVAATHVLTEIPRCRAGTEIVASGTFEPELGVEVSQLDVFLGR